MTQSNHYETLKLERAASADEIKRAYYKLVRQFPPERFPDEFREIREAYDTLSDGEARKDYDMTLKTREELFEDLPPEAVGQIELIKSEIERAHTGKAVKSAEELYAQYPDNATVATILIRAYIARGWTNKAYELVVSDKYQSVLKTTNQWNEYSEIAAELDISFLEHLPLILNGIAILSKNGGDDIDMCAAAYAMMYIYVQKSRHDFVSFMLKIPEEFNSTKKILIHILALAKRGLRPSESNSFTESLLAGIMNIKCPSELSEGDREELALITEIINASVDLNDLENPDIADIINMLPSALAAPKLQPVRIGAKIGRNELCPCGSGKKYKKCCLKN